jgi:hypothetical protein
MLQDALHGYKFRMTDDPLGFGLDLMFDQFIHGHPMQSALKPLSSRALHACIPHVLAFSTVWSHDGCTNCRLGECKGVCVGGASRGI